MKTPKLTLLGTDCLHLRFRAGTRKIGRRRLHKPYVLLTLYYEFVLRCWDLTAGASINVPSFEVTFKCSSFDRQRLHHVICSSRGEGWDVKMQF